MTEENMAGTAPQDATGGGQQPVGDVTISMTPAQLEARLQRERAKFSDYSDLQQKASRLAELERSQMDELERLKVEMAEADQARQRAQAEARTTLIRAAFVAEAAKAGVRFPEDAYDLADKAGVAEDGGKIVGVTEAVRSLVEAGRLPLQGKPKAPGLDAGAGGGDRGDTKPLLTGEELVMAQRLGLSPEQYAKGKATRREREVDAAEELEQLRAEVRHLRDARE